MKDFIAGLPKVELHLHQVGSASPRVVAELAARHPDTAVPTDPAAVEDYFTFRDFAHFAELYVSVVDLIQTPEDVRMLTYETARDLADQNVRYAELTVTPYSTVRRGMADVEFMAAIEDARTAAEADLGVVLRWCFDIPGDARAGLAAAEETMRLALDVGADGLVSLGLGGRESGAPRQRFKPYFDQARAAGLHSVPHAGETVGPDAIWAALDCLGAERIGHAVSAVHDGCLLSVLAERQIPVEVCLTSNIATGAVRDLAEHPIRRMAQAGVPIIINSDDPPMFGTDLNTEYAIAASLLELDVTGVAGLAKRAVTASFMDAAAKLRVHAEIDAYLASWTAPPHA